MHLAEIVAHQHGKGKMAGHGEQAARDSQGTPLTGSVNEIEYVFQSRKAHADAHGIDNGIETLVEIGIGAREAVEEEPLRQFLRNGRRVHLEDLSRGGQRLCRQHRVAERKDRGDVEPVGARHAVVAVVARDGVELEERLRRAFERGELLF